MSAHVLLAGAFSVVWLGCALTGLGLRDMRFSAALTYKHGRNLRKKFQVPFHVSVLLAAFPFYLVPRIQILLPVTSGIVCGQGTVLRVARVILKRPLKGRAPKASLSHRNLIHGLSGL